MSSDVKLIFNHQRVLICIDVIFDIAMFRIVLISSHQCYIYAGTSQQKRKIMSEEKKRMETTKSTEEKKEPEHVEIREAVHAVEVADDVEVGMVALDGDG